MTDTLFKPDCQQCADLCCVVFAFARSADFAHDKEAGEPCVNLAQEGGCRIFSERKQRGYSGCLAYDCLGAGQIVSNDIFAGRHWRQFPELLEPMRQALSKLKRLQEVKQLLHTARQLQLSAEDSDLLEKLRLQIDPAEGWNLKALDTTDIEGIEAGAAQFFQSLKKYISRQPRS